MRTTKALLAPSIGLLGVAMFAAPALASDAKGGFALHGVGAQTCQMMLQELPPAVPAAPAATPTAPVIPAAALPGSVTPIAALAAPTAALPAPAKPAVVLAATAAPSAGLPAPVAPAVVLAATGTAPVTLPASVRLAATAAAASPSTSATGSPPITDSAAPKSSPTGTPAGPISSAPAAPPASPATTPAALGMRPILTSWIMGYLTASDRLVKDTFDQTPVMAPEALTTMIIGVCHRYPDARVEAVANNVLNQLATARVLHESPVVEARAGDRVVLIRKATLVAMQNTLVQNKLLKDPADGTFGSSTAAALLAFQKSQNLPATGLPDASTVVRLLIEMQPAKVGVKGTRTHR